MSTILTRKIGDTQVIIAYDEFHKDSKKWAVEALDKEQAAYESAVQLVQNGLTDLVHDLETTHLRLEDIKQNTCDKCGFQTLKERKNRTRVFGGLFWTDSEPSPYKRCVNCGHDQEAAMFHPPHLESIRRQAKRRLELAQKLISKYNKVSDPRSEKPWVKRKARVPRTSTSEPPQQYKGDKR